MSLAVAVALPSDQVWLVRVDDERIFDADFLSFAKYLRAEVDKVTANDTVRSLPR